MMSKSEKDQANAHTKQHRLTVELAKLRANPQEYQFGLMVYEAMDTQRVEVLEMKRLLKMSNRAFYQFIEGRDEDAFHVLQSIEVVANRLNLSAQRLTALYYFHLPEHELAQVLYNSLIASRLPDDAKELLSQFIQLLGRQYLPNSSD